MLVAVLPTTKVLLAVLPTAAEPWACNSNRPRFWPCKLPPAVTSTSLAVVLARCTENLAPGMPAQALLSAV